MNESLYKYISDYNTNSVNEFMSKRTNNPLNENMLTNNDSVT